MLSCTTITIVTEFPKFRTFCCTIIIDAFNPLETLDNSRRRLLKFYDKRYILAYYNNVRRWYIRANKIVCLSFGNDHPYRRCYVRYRILVLQNRWSGGFIIVPRRNVRDRFHRSRPFPNIFQSKLHSCVLYIRIVHRARMCTSI